ncbi:MAG: hypothetical protein LBQ74_14115 [Prevotella sp.]|nr:hypothetical protein [Prevotella sp.]
MEEYTKLMGRVIFLARFTGTAISEILSFDVEFFEQCLISAKELHTKEGDDIFRVSVVGFEKR